MTRMTIRIDSESGAGFGPGKARLLELIAETASLRQAAAAMAMSYRQAWLLMQAAEAQFGAPLLATAVGGTGGGGSTLTPLGQEVLARYRVIEAKAAAAAKSELNAFGKLAARAGGKGEAPARRRLRPRKAVASD